MTNDDSITIRDELASVIKEKANVGQKAPNEQLQAANLIKKTPSTAPPW
jgi:hypothetical protein